MARLSFIVVGLLSVFGFSASAGAVTPDSLGTFGKWQAYSYQEDGAPVCFISGVPDKKEGAYKRRDPVYFMVTHRPKEAATHVVSFLAGYTYKNGADVTVMVDNQKFSLLGQDNTAWAPDPETDLRLVTALKKGGRVVVEGVSGRGTRTKDSFSLKGSGDAMQAIDKACSVQ